MSRTDKDRPYWVKVQDHGVEHHDHSRLGEEVWYSRDVKDEDGKIVYEELPFYYTVGDVLAPKDARLRDPWAYFSNYPLTKRTADGSPILRWRWTGYRETEVRAFEKVRNEAMWFRANGGNNGTLVVAGTYMRPKQERYLAYTIPDHCTIGEKDLMVGRWRNANPCYMEANYANDYRIYACSCSMCNPGRDHEGDRAFKRNTLRNMTKAANSGDEDWEDGFEGRNLTPPRRAGQSWW